VLRLPGKDTGLLEIDREAERAANAMAASAGVAPEVAAFLADEGILVTRFVTGESVESEELREPVLLAEVAGRLHAVHSGPPLPSTFDSFRIVETYRDTAATHGARIPDAYDDALALARRLEPAMSGPEHAPVPCHNDLLSANFICSDGRVWIVDWEYAGMGDRYFDLANLSINNGFGEDDDRRLAGGLLPRARHGAALRLAAPHAGHVGLPRGHVGRGADGRLRAGLRLRRLCRRALRAAHGHGRRPALRGLARGGAWRSGVTRRPPRAVW
jgi:aminoglycoside phosphotransferase (APT) family kinase protein